MSAPSSIDSDALFERAQRVFPGGVNSPVRAFTSVRRNPFIVSHGEGPYLFDVDGNRYVDFINSWGPLVLGHAPAAVRAAIIEQCARGTSFGACCALETELAELIQSHVPSMEMMRFVNSGTEAGMSVIRLARGFTGRSKLLKCNGCYHGHADTLLVKAGSGIATLGIPGCAGVPASYVSDTLVTQFNNVAMLEEFFAAHGDSLAAFILEPVCGNAGLILPEPEFLNTARALCSKHGALLIFDEVMTGFRVHTSGAQGLFNIVPDLTMLGKVIGGGLPVGAFGGRRDVMEYLAPVGPVYQAGTLSGNPLAMAAGLATLTEWLRPGVFDATASRTAWFANQIAEIASRENLALQVGNCGTMFGIFFSDSPVCSYEDALQSDIESFISFFNRALDQGVYFAPSAFEAGFVSAAHSQEVLEAALAVVNNILSSSDGKVVT